MTQNLLERLSFADEKNLLIQGLPSSIEKQFVKLSYAKNVTPLLRNKKIDFALVFAINQSQLCSILEEVLPALSVNAKFWIAFPKAASKIVSDLNRVCSWEFVTQAGYEKTEDVEMDHVWVAQRFMRVSPMLRKGVKTVSTRMKMEVV